MITKEKLKELYFSSLYLKYISTDVNFKYAVNGLCISFEKEIYISEDEILQFLNDMDNKRIFINSSQLECCYMIYDEVLNTSLKKFPPDVTYIRDHLDNEKIRIRNQKMSDLGV